ncbi:MAG: thioredoxin family protein [Thermoguttaceae bacterium]|nr:thioredoxin family protein [Thermoguttaceae bacterium]MDW8036926.1 thioredoxin family protein [Thermoguttaceae bacterium]
MFIFSIRFFFFISLPLTILLGCNWPGIEPASQGEQPSSLSLPTEKAHVSFLTDYAEAVELARQWEKPLLVLFTASWCPFSRQMLQESFRDPQITRLSKQFICIQVDIEQNPSLAQKHQVRVLPAVQILSSRGVIVCRLNGYLSAKQLTDSLQQSIQLLASRPQTEATLR